MSKGCKRRPEDRAAIEQNWERALGLKPRAPRATVVETRSRSVCTFCYRIINKCERCHRDHCPCTPISNCQDPRPLRRAKPTDPLDTNPYGFVQHRSGFAGGMSHE